MLANRELRTLFFAVLCVSAVILLAGCKADPAAAPSRCPPDCPYHRPAAAVTLPKEIRQENWMGEKGRGSCAWAALCDVLRSQGEFRAARGVTAKGDGATVAMLADYCRSQKIPVAWTTKGDVCLLEWCSATRRPAVIHWTIRRPGDHAVTFLGFRSESSNPQISRPYALIADNNDPGRMQRIPKDAFLAAWHKAGGCALTVIATPLPPEVVGSW